MPYVLGIDAGGTKTFGLLADESGRVHAKARAGGANLHVHGEQGVEQVLSQILEQLEPPSPLAAVCLGIAGAGRDADRQILGGVLQRLGIDSICRLENDAFVALAAGAPERYGIVVISGTGSIAYGVSPAGETARSGGWGYLLGDEGSAFWLGHAALRRGMRAADGRGPHTTFGERVGRKLGVEMPDGLVAWFYDQEQSRQRVAELAPLVEEAAKDGDASAEQLLDEAALHLARAAQSVDRQLSFPSPYSLVLAGGAFRACPSLFRRVEACLGLGHARPVRLEDEPATGAVRLALDLL